MAKRRQKQRLVVLNTSPTSPANTMLCPSCQSMWFIVRPQMNRLPTKL
jgi:hypothetical protein